MMKKRLSGAFKILYFFYICLPAQVEYKHNHIFYSHKMSLNDNIDIITYHIDLELQPDAARVVGRSEISFMVTAASLEYVSLNLVGLTVDSVFCKEQKIEFSHNNRELTLAFDSPVAENETTRVLIYYGGYPERGFYFRDNRYGNPVIYSHNEPYDARYWFPCKDNPADKALLEMHLFVPDSYRVLSNGILIEENYTGEGINSFLWKEDYPVATYLISLAAAPYDIIQSRFIYQGTEMPVFYYTYPEDSWRAQESLEWTVQMLEFFSNYIGIYPFIKEKYAMAEVPLQEAGAMENQTATTMGEGFIDREDVVAHELAHQWWGDALTPMTFADIWLNEGFATFFDALFTEHKYGREPFENRMVQMISRLGGDGSLEYPIYNPPDRYWFGSAVYLKGAWVLHMLRTEIGEDLFRQVCRTYYNRYVYKNVETEDFITVCEELCGQSMQPFFNQWLMYGGMPILHGSWKQNNSKTEITITQTQSDPLYHFPLEVLLNFHDRDSLITIPFSAESHVIHLYEPESLLEVIIDPNHKILNSNNSPVFHIPKTADLLNTYPNPFNNTLHIRYQLPTVQTISLDIYNLKGQKVATVYKGRGLAGINDVVWKNSNLASGIYFCRLTFRDGSDVRKIMLVK